MNKLEQIDQKLAQIRDLRSKNRRLRIKYKKDSFSDDNNSENVEMYVESSELARPLFIPSIIPTFFSPDPPSTVVNRDSACISSLAALYRIGKCDNSGDWFIVAPQFHIPKIFDPDVKSFKNTDSVFSVLVFASKLLLLLSQEMHKVLPHPIKMEGNRIIIVSNVHEYDLLTTDPFHLFKKAVLLLNCNAQYMGGGEVNELLPNLFAAMHKDQPYPL